MHTLLYYQRGVSCLINASRNGQLDIVLYLLSKGASIDSRDMVSVLKLKRLEKWFTLYIYIYQGGVTALMHACVEEKFEVIRALVEAGANLNVVNKVNQDKYMPDRHLFWSLNPVWLLPVYRKKLLLWWLHLATVILILLNTLFNMAQS